ncbi:hypothetical protein O3M35_007115 [Rhynocoris fuscipes]|uniref:Secreted protein n=1 Tax=Rhynocoris fuscipes TaxID=488301 RepID=A0AAW1DDW2_9HEMI
MKAVNIICLIYILLTFKTAVVQNEIQNETVLEIRESLSVPVAYLMKALKEPIEWYKDNIAKFYGILFKFINSSELNDCEEAFYQTEGNLLEILVRELLNNMHITANDQKTNEKDTCNKIQIWIEYLINTLKNEFCNNIHINYKLFDVISVLCKHTNRQVQTSVENLKDLMKTPEKLIAECIEAIKLNDFKTGERKLKLINDINTEFIVKEIYNNNEENFEKVLKFFSNIGNIRKSFVGYKFLYESIENSVKFESYKYYKLYENINKIYHIKTYPNIEISVANMRQSLENKLQTYVADELLDSYKDNNSAILFETNIFADIYRNFKHLYYDGVKIFLKEICCKNQTCCDKINLMNFVRRRNYYGEIILSLKAIYEELNLTDNERFQFAYHIRYLSNIDYKSSQKDKLVLLKENLPISIRNLLFSKFICIKNLAHDEYLTSDNFTKITDNAKILFTMQTYDINSNHLWKIDCLNLNECNRKYRIKNLSYNQLLYASNDYDYSYHSDNRKIIVKDIGNTIDNYSLWEFQAYGDYVYIKSIAHDTYMFVDNQLYDEKAGYFKRIAYTWIPSHSKLSARNFQWLIEDCSNVSF